MSPKSVKDAARRAPERLTLESEAQQVLNELWAAKLIPFKLAVGKIAKASGHYILHFYDSRMHTAEVPLTEGQSWAEMVRIAVLDRVAKLGPLRKE